MFVHRATSEDIEGNETYVDHPSLNGNPDALFSVTPNWNPGAGTYVNAPVATRYDAGEEKWAILTACFIEDGRVDGSPHVRRSPEHLLR